jgi:hypothetical protein
MARAEQTGAELHHGLFAIDDLEDVFRGGRPIMWMGLVPMSIAASFTKGPRSGSAESSSIHRR